MLILPETSLPLQMTALKLSPQAILPRYDGYSIANLPPTVGRALGVSGWAAPPVAQPLKTLQTEAERVILLLLDGIGYRRLLRQLEHDPRLLELLQPYGAELAPLTSVSPATTSVATTTLWGDGSAPAAHGMLGYTFLLPSLGLVANMLFWYGARHAKPTTGELERWGIQPESFLPTPSIAQVLTKEGVATTALMPAGISRSPLSRMQMRGAEVNGYINATDMYLQLQSWLGKTRRGYMYAYYPDFDSFSHRDGPDAPSWEALWDELLFSLERFLTRLSPTEKRETLLLISADHGHVASPLAKRQLLRDHPGLTEHLSLAPGGEGRHLLLYARPGHGEAIEAYARERLKGSFYLLKTQEALEAGLYGDPRRQHPETTRRLGDYILLPDGEAHLWDGKAETVLLGMHGGLEPDEMLVPLIALRLDS